MSNAAYKLWYEYLKETEPSAWSESVRIDFAGVLDQDFDGWFDENRFDLFLDTFVRPTTEYPVWSIEREDYEDDKDYLLAVLGEKRNEDEIDFGKIFGELDHIVDHDERMRSALSILEDQVEANFVPKSHLVLVVNLSYPKDKLLEWINTLITASKGKLKKGRPAEKKSFAKYPFARRPDISSLEIALAAHRLKKLGMPNWQVGNELTKIFPILKDHKITEKKNDGDEEDLNAVNKKKVLESAAWRYLKLADAVLEGVTQGIFPAK